VDSFSLQDLWVPGLLMHQASTFNLFARTWFQILCEYDINWHDHN